MIFSFRLLLIGLTGFAASSSANLVSNGNFEADLGVTVGTNIAYFTQSVSGWFEKNGTTRGDALQWDLAPASTPIPDDVDGEVWGLLNVSNLNQSPSNSPGAFYQSIGTNSDDLDVYVSLDVGVRGGSLPFANVNINLYSGNVTGADGSSLSGLGATLLDTYTITDSIFTTAPQSVALSAINLNTGTNGVDGETLWLEFTVQNLGGFDQPNQALIDDIVVSESAGALGVPNIIVIMGDDIGYGDVGCNGADTNIVATPNIDRLADEGLRFTSGYCANSTCTPSRYALMTGQYAWRESGTGIGAINSPLKIDQDRMTIADVLKAAGYATAVIGKWHLGLGAGAPDWNGLLNPGPLELGFDYCFLLPNTNDRVPPVYVENHEVLNLDTNDPIIVSSSEIPNSNPYSSVDTNTLTYASSRDHDDTVWNGVGRIGYMSGGMTARFRDEDMGDDFLARALPWIENAASNSAPFFLFFSSQDNHVPRLPHERFQGTTSLGWRTDAIAELDWGVGQILDKIAALGIETNTLVIFCSDNGPVYDDGYDDGTTVYQSSQEVDRGHDGSGIYRGGKYQVYEGGTRTPFITWWPGRITPGAVSDEIVSSIDFAASFAALTGQTFSDTNAFPDSVNLIGALLGENGALGRNNLIQADNQGSNFGFRQGDWKLVNTNELYHLPTDPGEQTNVASLYPDKRDDLLAWRNHLMSVESSASISLVASGGVGAVDLDWMDSSSTNFSSFSVSRGALQGGPYATIASNLTASAFPDTNVVTGTTYYYVVTTMYGGGVPPSESNEASAMPLAASTNLLLEAEDAVISSGAINSLGSGWSGTGYVDMDEGSYIEFLFHSSGGMYDLEIQAAGAENGMALEVSVNGSVIDSALVLPNTGSWNANWERTTISNVTLTAGVNTLRYRDNGNNQPQVDRLLLIESASGTEIVTWTGGGDGYSLFQEANWDGAGGTLTGDYIKKSIGTTPYHLVIDVADNVGGGSGWNGTLDLGGVGSLSVTGSANYFRMNVDENATLKNGTATFKQGIGDFDFEGTWDNMDVTITSGGIDVPAGTLSLINGTTVDTQWCAYNTTTVDSASILYIRGNGNIFANGWVNMLDHESKIVFTGGKTVAAVISDHLSGDTSDVSTSAAGRILINGQGAVHGTNVYVYTDSDTGYTTVRRKVKVVWTGDGDGVSLFQEANWDAAGGVLTGDYIPKGPATTPHDLVISNAGSVGGVNGWNGTLDLGGVGSLTVTGAADYFRMDTSGNATIKDGTVTFTDTTGDFDLQGTFDNVDAYSDWGTALAGAVHLVNSAVFDTVWFYSDSEITSTLNGGATLIIREDSGTTYGSNIINFLDLGSKIVYTDTNRTVAEVTSQHLSNFRVNGSAAVVGSSINVFTDPQSGYTTVQRLDEPLMVYTSDGPNIIYIICDDLGYGDLGVLFQNSRSNGVPRHATPQLDTMATAGMQLRSHYCPAPVCAPSRSSLLSGVHQGHSEVRDNQFDKALANNHSLASMLNTAGYKTAAFGKWGLQGSGTAPYWEAHPLSRGFDYFYGYIRHGDGHRHYPKEDGKEVYENYDEVSSGLDKCYTTDLFTGGAKRWITNHLASAEADKPMFLYLAYDTPHAILQYPSTAYPAGGGLTGGVQWVGTPGAMINTATGTVDGYIHPDYASATYDHDGNPGTAEIAWPDIAKRWAGGVRRIDDAVGDLMVLLDDLNIATNTLIVFTSDNGVTRESYLAASFEPGFFDSFGPFDGIKRDTWEGGIRMPALTYWPGTIPSNTISDAPSAFWDWMPTFAELAGQPVPAISDGVSLVPELTGADSRDDSTIYVEYYQNGSTPTYPEFETTHQGRQRNQMQVVQLEGYKGVRYNVTAHSDDFEIYDVINDPKETSNLATNPSLVGLQQRMKDRVLQLRRPNGTAVRPYDSESVPPASVSGSFTNGLTEYAIFEGAWPWLPGFAAMTPAATGTVAGVDLSIAPSTNQYGVLFTGYLDIKVAGDYTFYLTSDKGANLRIHDALVIDDDYLHTGAEVSGTIKLAIGKHPFRLSYRHEGGSESLSFLYQGPGIAKQTVPLNTYAIPDGAALSAYEEWAASYGLTNGLGAEEYDVEPDGLQNLLEYALGGNPTNVDGSAVLPRFMIAGDGGTNWLYYIHNERNDPSLLYTVQAATNLVIPSWETNGVEWVGESAWVDGYKSVTNRTDLEFSPKYLRLRVAQ